jgi:methionine-rich copper-binding protein CopC
LSRLTIAGLIATLPVWVSGPAAAHAFLDSATPGVGSTVKPTDTISLRYTEGVEPAFSKVTVAPDGGDPLAADKPALDPGNPTVLVLHVAAPLAPGKYRVNWHVVSVDTHQTEGSFTFTVAP